MRFVGTGLCWGTLLVVIGIAGGGLYVYSRINNEVQKHVLAELQKKYPELDIQIGSAQIVENKGIIVKKIEFSVPGCTGQSKNLPLLYIDELFIECPVTLQSLYQKNLRISRIVVQYPILRASRVADGTFPELQHFVNGNKDPLFLFPQEGNPILVEIENGTLLYYDLQQSQQPFRVSDINITVTPEIRNSIHHLFVQGAANGDFFRRITFDAELLPETKQWKFIANCQEFDWSDDIWQYIPPHPYIKERPRFSGRFMLNVSADSGNTVSDSLCRFSINGELTHGRLDFPHINRTLTELAARFEISNDGVTIDKLTGSSDGAQFAASFVQDGLTFFGDSRQQAELTVNIRNLRFDDELIESFSPFLNSPTKQFLTRFDYEGTTDVHAQLSCKNGAWQPKNVEMQISEIGFSYRAFPYRLDRLAGSLFVDETAALHFHFTSKQDAPLKAVIDGHYYNIFVTPFGKVEVVGSDVPIDLKLIRSLPPEVQQVVNSLNPVGKLNARLLFELPQGHAPLNKQFDIALDQVSLRYNHFPYPLRDITGSLYFDGTVWQFRNVTGSNGTAVAVGNGYLRPIGSAYAPAQEFVLHVDAKELPVDNQMTQALLHPDQRQLLKSLNVNGKVNLVAQIQYRTDDKQLHLNFQAIPLPGLSICADRFPYKIENIDGEIQYANGHVFAETLRGIHQSTKLQCRLDCRFDVAGQSVLRLESLVIDQLQANRDLFDALPKYLRNFVESLELTRPFNLTGGIEYRQTPQGEQAVGWDLNWILFQNSANLGMHFENIFGAVRLRGQSVGEQLMLDGELNVDSLTVNGFQATAVRGPFSFDGKLLRLGVPANPMRQTIPARPMTGKFCDGTIRAVGWVTLDNGITYSINADLIGADVSKIAREIEPTVRTTSGTLNCIDLTLRGIGTKWETVSGAGTIQLRDANIYGAPVMIRLLRELRMKETDPNAGMFSSVDVAFRLSGLQMFVDSVIFEGGAISLQGNGRMRMDTRQVDLAMKTRLGNRRTQIPLISDLFNGVGDQLIQLQVSGTLSDPTVTRVALPEIQNVVQQMQPEETITPPTSKNRLAPSKMLQWNPF